MATLLSVALLAALALASQPPAGRDLYIPQKFFFNGTFDIVYANVSQPLAVWQDGARNLQKLSYFDDLHYVLVNGDVYAYEFMKNHSKVCGGYNSPIGVPMTGMFPDLARFSYVATERLNEQMVYHYQFVQNEHTAGPEGQDFLHARSDRQDFYCLPSTDVENKPYCTPIRWEMHGYNQWTGSHYSYYALNYERFEIQTTFSDDVFAVPGHCTIIGDGPGPNPGPTARAMPTGSLLDLMVAFASSEGDRELLANSFEHTRARGLQFSTAPNLFTGMSRQEFLRAFTGRARSSEDDGDYLFLEVPEHTDDTYRAENGWMVAFPDEFDWRAHGIVPPVRDQCSCGSCWAFGAVGTLEGALNARRWKQGIRNEPLVRLSEEAIISCIWGDMLNGCNGGLSYEANDMLVQKFKGKYVLADSMPYQGVEFECDESLFTDAYGRVAGARKIPRYDIGAMKYALLQGPVQVAISVPESMIWYAGGVYYDPEAANGVEDLAHSVVCVGWGRDEVYGEYWILRNSWSNAWGIDGYIYVSMKDNNAGVLTDADCVVLA